MITYKIKLTTKRFFKNKLNYIIVILIGLCFALSIMVNSLTYSTSEHYKKSILNWIDNRIFWVLLGDENASIPKEKREQLIEKLNSLDEVAGVFGYDSYMSSWYISELTELHPEWEENVSIGLNGVVETMEAIIGENLSKEDEMTMICPNKYYPFETIEAGGVDKTKEIDLTSYIGEYFTIKYIDSNNPKEFKIKLVGLYDNDILNKNYRECYANYKTMAKINEDIVPQRDAVIYYELKNITFEDRVTGILNEMGYYPSSKIFLHDKIALDSLETLSYISYGIFVITIVTSLSIIYYSAIKDKENVRLNKILGYQNKNIIANYLFEILIIFIASIIITLILSLLLLIIFKNIIPIYYPMFKDIPILLSSSAIIKSGITIFIISCIIGIIKTISLSNKP